MRIDNYPVYPQLNDVSRVSSDYALKTNASKQTESSDVKSSLPQKPIHLFDLQPTGQLYTKNSGSNLSPSKTIVQESKELPDFPLNGSSAPLIRESSKSSTMQSTEPIASTEQLLKMSDRIKQTDSSANEDKTYISDVQMDQFLRNAFKVFDLGV